MSTNTRLRAFSGILGVCLNFLLPLAGADGAVNDSVVFCGSCENRCGTLLPPGFSEPACFCDHDCLRHHDCCHDYPLHCTGSSSQNNTTTDEMTPHADQAAKEMFWRTVDVSLTGHQECRPVPLKSGVTHRRMITTCSLACHTYNKYRQLCENEHPNLKANSSLRTPVAYRGLIYKNKYCLECHELYINASQVKTSTPNYKCANQTLQNDAIGIYYNRSYEAFINFLSENCNFFVNLGGRHFNGAHQSCDPDSVEYCLFDETEMDGSAISLASAVRYCPLYQSLVSVDIDGRQQVYKNAHCALCSGASNIECKHPPLPVINSAGANGDYFPSFSLLMDFDGTESKKMSFNGATFCTETEYLDVESNKCVKMVCPRDAMFIEGTCVLLNFTSNEENIPIVNDTDHNIILLKLHFRSLMNESNLNMEQVKNISLVFLKKMHWDRRLRHTEYDSNCTLVPETNTATSGASEAGNLNHSVCMLLHINTGKVKIPLKSYDIQRWLRNIDTGILAAHDRVSQVQVYVFHYTPSVIATPKCRAGSLAISTDLVFSKVGDMLVRSVTHVIDNSTGMKYEYGKLPMGGSFGTGDYGDYDPQYFAFLCLPQIIQCDKARISKSTMHAIVWSKNDSGVFIEGSQLEEGSFLILSDDTLLVCMDILANLTNTEAKQSLNDQIQGILTMIGNILSPLFLIFTFITYCLFRSMRTVPGLCIMNLCVSLSFAQILFQLGPLLSGRKTACLVAAAFQHYMWLVSFLWMNVLAYITCKTFTGRGAGGVCEKSGFRRYLVYAWIVPLVFVGTCVAVDLLTTLPFSYGGGSQCWLTGKTGLIFFFAVPLAIIIAVNLVLFSRTLMAIKRTMDVAKQAKEKADDQQRFVIYVKLSSVMGFTWLFGFLANLTVLNILWYVFIVLNTSQGVFIAMSFVLTRRVMKKYKALFTGERVDSSSSSRSGATRSTKASVPAY